MNTKHDEALAHAYKLFRDELALCDCGQPWQGYELVLHLLAIAPYYEHPEKVTQAIGSEGATHLVLSMLTNADLIEHGGGIGGSWLTPKGKWFREVLRSIESWEDFHDGRHTALPPHGGTPCTDDCWATPTD
ncbi:hypothetical protein ABT282_08840 [Streptomyces sp. NPDC000927]|uniref:hypothetical protein n=1 Tax=Streptomyces sp. NPDC000927 TaxID=3154371 RepID=UPI0033180951